MKMYRAVATACAGAIAFGCAPAAGTGKGAIDTARIFDAIKADEVRWNRDWKSGNPALISGHYAPTAVWMVPGAPPMVGGAAIRAGIAQSLDDKSFSLSFSSEKVDVAKSGDLATARGSYALAATEPKTKAVITEKGSYVTVYKPQPGGLWKVVWEINAPGAPAPAAK